MSMGDPQAYFLTWVTYGTWLPGDRRGWVSYNMGWKEPNSNIELISRNAMNERSCILGKTEREHVEEQIRETCEIRRWFLHAVNCRSNHVHVVVAAYEAEPKKVRRDLKAWTTRRLKTLGKNRQNWWAERGSIQFLFTDQELENAVKYVNEAQDRTPTE